MVYAAGSVLSEQWLAAMRRSWAIAIRALAWTALLVDIAFFGTFLLPVGQVNSAWWKVANEIQGDYREELGWQELTQTAAQIRDELPAEDRAHLGILAGNYGEAGAINLYSERYNLPRAINSINSFWARGYGDPPPQT